MAGGVQTHRAQVNFEVDLLYDFRKNRAECFDEIYIQFGIGFCVGLFRIVTALDMEMQDFNSLK